MSKVNNILIAIFIIASLIDSSLTIYIAKYYFSLGKYQWYCSAYDIKNQSSDMADDCIRYDKRI